MNDLIKNRIQKQLLNFNQDIEFDKSNSVQKTIDKSIEKEKWILENTVDLGLPSGTLWMKNNLGATCGDTEESWFGNYYAYGELCHKIRYTKDNYTYKDCSDIIPLDYDIAYQKTNGICSIPSKEQIEELIKNTKSEWIENYNKIKGLNGRVFTGSNGNILFSPAAGCYYSSRGYNQGTNCNLWSSSVNQSNTDYAYYLSFSSGNVWVSDSSRYYGRSVRGVL